MVHLTSGQTKVYLHHVGLSDPFARVIWKRLKNVSPGNLDSLHPDRVGDNSWPFVKIQMPSVLSICSVLECLNNMDNMREEVYTEQQRVRE